MATVGSIIKDSLLLLKAKESGESLSADEEADGIRALNQLIGKWNLQPLMQVAKTQLTQALTASDGLYTFGTGGDNSTRPIRITKAFVRSSTNVDYPMRIISNEEYSLISFKTITSTYPYNLYYRDSYPLGEVNLFPVPSTTGYTLYLETQSALSTYTLGSDTVDLPDGYELALIYNLAVQMGPQYKEASPSVRAEANDSIAWIKRMNTDDKPIMANTARMATRGGYGGYFVGVS